MVPGVKTQSALVCNRDSSLTSGAAFSQCKTFCKRECLFNAIERQSIKQNDCWLWQGRRNNNGYAQKFIKRKNILIHRIIAAMIYGLNLTDKTVVVMHSCDNKNCLNPKHLRLGTCKLNTQEAIERGLWSSQGINNANAKLNDDKVKEIRLKFKHGHSNRSLAEIYNVKLSTIWHVTQGKTWRHVE